MNWLDKYYGRIGDPFIAPLAPPAPADPLAPIYSYSPTSFPGSTQAQNKPKSSGTPSKAIDTQTAIDRAVMVQKALKNAGFPDYLQPYVMDQAAYETAGFTSPAFVQDNNASGIRPSKYAKKGHTSYAGYANLDAWARDMKRIISMNGPTGKPIDAASLPDYIHRLKANKYFTDSEKNYLDGVTATGVRWRNIMSLDDDTHQKIVIPGTDKASYFKAHPLVTGLVLAAGGIVLIKIISN